MNTLSASFGLICFLVLAEHSQAQSFSVESERLGTAPQPASVWQQAISQQCCDIAIIANDKDAQTLIVNGETIATGHISGAALSPEGKHVAYASVNGKGVSVILDGKEQKTFPQITGMNDHGRNEARLFFSPDGRHLAYIVRLAPHQECAVVDGTQDKIYPGVDYNSFTFSPDSKHWAYLAYTDKDIAPSSPLKNAHFSKLSPPG